MKVTVDIPFKAIYGLGDPYIEELHLKLPENATLEELVHAFKTIMYAQTYTSDTIEETFGGEE